MQQMSQVLKEQECLPELLADNLMFVSLPYTASNIVLENLAVCTTSHTTPDQV
jgi:hypothetical protein